MADVNGFYFPAQALIICTEEFVFVPAYHLYSYGFLLTTGFEVWYGTTGTEMCTNIKQIAMEKIMKNCLKLPVFFLVFMVLNPLSFFLTAAIDTQARAEGRNDAVGLATSSQGFDKAYYLDAKLTQLKAIDPVT